MIVRDLSTGKGKSSVDMGTSQVVRNGGIAFRLFDAPETPRTADMSRKGGMITGVYHGVRRFGSDPPKLSSN